MGWGESLAVGGRDARSIDDRPSAAERAVLDLSVAVMESLGGLDITSEVKVAAHREPEARWGAAVRTLMAERGGVSDGD